jgi:uroporphyrinogen decarboxylase
VISERENFLRSVEFRYPEWIPISVNLPQAVWGRYREELENMVICHPIIFGEYKRGSRDFGNYGPVQEGKRYYKDEWGCTWLQLNEGLEGQVVGHPLADWKALDTFELPDPLINTDWDGVKQQVEKCRQQGILTIGGIDRFFDRLQFLRGFENLMIDLVTDPPELPILIELLLEYNMKLIHKWLEMSVDIMHIHSDIGTQKGLMMSPKAFRKHIKPAYKKMFMTCRDAGTHVNYSSDGNLLEVVDDLIGCGVSIHDPQLRACTLEGIVKAYKRKMCVKVDLDEQMFAFCTPEDIREQVKEVVERLYSPQGGLMLYGEPGPDVPLENIQAICSALEEFRCYH